MASAAEQSGKDAAAGERSEAADTTATISIGGREVYRGPADAMGESAELRQALGGMLDAALDPIAERKRRMQFMVGLTREQRQILYTGAVLLAQELVKTYKQESKVGNDVDETLEKLLAIKGGTLADGTEVTSVLHLLNPGAGLPSFLQKMVINTQLSLLLDGKD